MHGVPNDLRLERFHGATLTQICIGEFQQQFHFTDPALHISIEGDWRVTNSSGEVIDQSVSSSERDAYRVHQLLGQTIVAHQVAAPEFFVLRFSNGWSLVVFDTSSEYESFSIQPGDVFA